MTTNTERVPALAGRASDLTSTDVAGERPSDAEADLQVLASEISAAHFRCQDAFNAAVADAIRAGELLIRAKALVGHGRWLSWLATHFPASVRTAQNYMRLARRAEDAQRVAHLGVGAALRALQGDSQRSKHQVAELIAELRLRDGWPEFLACARALIEIRDRALYRQTHPSFRAYLDERWGLDPYITQHILDLAEEHV